MAVTSTNELLVSAMPVVAWFAMFAVFLYDIATSPVRVLCP